ncbi:unnamed protein product [Urochloa decumbens]|uniref:F-box domain-containing protein n=1 Tax=Urochloa decumbens TaxID=240449 RepID=A0ABC9GGP2_9POAL
MVSTDEEENNRQPPWSRLLPELVSMICQRLCPSDVPRFGAVCKRWHCCAYPLYPADSTPILISNTISDSGLIRCYSPYLNKMFIVRTPLRAPESRIFSAAVDGRVILRRPDKTILFGSLLDGSAFETTESKYDEGYFWTSNEDGTGHPEKCGILGFCPNIHKLRVQSWNGERWKYFGYSSDEDDSSSDEDDSSSDSSLGSNSDSDSDPDWDDVENSDEEGEEEEMEMEKGYTDSDLDSDSNSDSVDSNDGEDADKEGEEETEEETEDVEEMEVQEGNLRLFTMSCSRPVLHKGLWYFLGGGGSLGVYDPKTFDWSLLSRPTSFGSEFPHKNCYLVESSQELLAVLTGRDGTPINVLKLKEEEMTWERMDSLGSRAIFTGTMASLSMAKPPKAMANKVYLPKFYGHPQIIPAKLTACRGRFFFVPERKEMQQPSSNKPVYNFMREHDTCGDKEEGAWCYDLELDSGVDKEIRGCKNMLQYIWVHLGRSSP